MFMGIELNSNVLAILKRAWMLIRKWTNKQVHTVCIVVYQVIPMCASLFGALGHQKLGKLKDPDSSILACDKGSSIH